MFRSQNLRRDGKVFDCSAAEQASRKNPLAEGRWASQREQVESAYLPRSANLAAQLTKCNSCGTAIVRSEEQAKCADFGADENLRIPGGVNETAKSAYL